MINRMGYACINTSIEKNFKDCRLASVYKNGISFLKEIILHNLNLTKETLLWNIDRNILMYRASSKLIPFSTHNEVLRDFEFRWYMDEDILKILDEIKSLVLENNIILQMGRCLSGYMIHIADTQDGDVFSTVGYQGLVESVI